MDQFSPDIPLASHTRVREIARKVANAPADERRTVLDRECDGDRVLRSRVELMLLRQDQIETLAEPEEVPISDVAGFAGSQRMGRYTIVRILGEGGMGVVYLAEQDRPKRTVALKVIRPGLLTPRLLRRFEHESETLAKLQHPGIAQIFEAATHESPAGPQPYFAMELVEGRPLTLDAFEKQLDLRARLDLFRKVCDAVQHAHQKGIIHRDLKPGNILVTPQGQPKVLDFGIARAADDSQASGATMRTEAGTLVGTLPYMSPEQVHDPSGVDVRSDVYTLGVILFELLTGKLPHALDTHTLPEAVRIIAEVEAPALNSIDRSIPADLATITAKAMEKDRSRRYQSASDLEADLGRFLRDEPILARPPSRAYKIKKFVRRNRALVAGASLAVLALVAGVIGTAWQAAEATRGRQLAEQRGLELERQKQIAETEAETAKAVNLFLAGMLEGANPESEGGSEVTVQQIMERAARQLEADPPPPGVQVPLRVTISNTYRGLGRFKDAVTEMERAAILAAQSFGPSDDRTINARRNLAVAYADAGRLEEAEAVTREVMPLVLAKHGESGVETARMRCEFGRVLIERGNLKDAEVEFRAGLSVLKEALSENEREVQQAMHNFGTALSSLGKLDEAEQLLRRTADLRAKSYGPDHLLVAYSLNSLSSVLQRQGKKDEALALLRRVLEMRLKHLPSDHPSVLVSKGNLAVGLMGVGNAPEARTLLTEVMEIQVRTLGETHQKTLSTMGNLAYVLEEQKEVAQAEKLYRRIIDLRRSSGQMDSDSWNQFNNIAMLLMADGRPAEAETFYRELLEKCREKLPADHWALALFRNNFGECLTRLGKYEEAEKELMESHPRIEEFFKPGHARVKKSQERIENLARASNNPGLSVPGPSPGSKAK